MPDSEKLTDKLGREYGPGDTIVYATGIGSHGCQLTVGTVLEIQHTNAKGDPLRGPRLKVRPTLDTRRTWRGMQYVPKDQRAEGDPAYVKVERPVLLTMLDNVLRFDVDG